MSVPCLRWALALVVVMALGTAAMAGCGAGGSGSAASSATTSPAASTAPTGASSTSPPSTITSATATTTSAGATVSSLAPPITVDRSWSLLVEPYYVWGVAAGDVLNARTGPGVAKPVVTTLDPGTRGVRVYSPYERIGQELWRPIQVDGGAAWVNARYLRPVGPASPQVTGSVSPAVTAAASQVADALRRLDLAALARLASPAGVRISPHAFVADEAVTVTPDQIATASNDSTVKLWGYTDGEGAPIRETLLERLQAISGSTALTSTSAIGYDVRIRGGNSLDNIATAFPGDPVVEYNFAGTSLFQDYDWTSVRLVFDTSGSAPLLVSIVQDTWTI